MRRFTVPRNQNASLLTGRPLFQSFRILTVQNVTDGDPLIVRRQSSTLKAAFAWNVDPCETGRIILATARRRLRYNEHFSAQDSDRGEQWPRRADRELAARRVPSHVAGESAMTGKEYSQLDTSRSLLLGLLAFQNNFIDRDALLGAFTSWVADNARLGPDLARRRRSRRCGGNFLEALVDEHIRLHGDDPEKSLAVLSSIGSVRHELSRLADPEVQDSLAHVSAAPRSQIDDRYGTVAGSTFGESTSAGTRFRILRPHAKGGLGQEAALDTELNRDVALKEIQDNFADDPRFRARFEFEAEVTGGLEHPGIVPVYGLGHTADGRPFYAMRFIKGNSLKEAIGRFHEAEKQPQRDPGRSTLELRELLGRFIDVCDAIAYAHSRGVLHRDLKPGNIMLGSFGETLVVDWGLAKALDEPELESPATQSEAPLKPTSGSELQPTLAGSAVGTPAYMSPEQVDGRLGKLGARSDVYCLGATLYHLLTGRAPCEAEQVGDVYKKVLTGDIPRPRSINGRIAPALEAICLKALSLTIEARYPTVHALKADLELWLADEPVSAYDEPHFTRLKRPSAAK